MKWKYTEKVEATTHQEKRQRPAGVTQLIML